MARKSGVGSGTGPVTETAHTVQPQFTGDDIALGITFQFQIGERRSMVVQTHIAQSASAKEMNTLADKVWAVLDRTGLRYRLKELLLEKQKHADQLALSMSNFAATQERWEADWSRSERGRRGPFVLTQAQQSTRAQHDDMVDRYRKQIAALETEIRDTERLIEAG